MNKWEEVHYFNADEFDSPDEKGSGKNMDTEFMFMLDDARDMSGIPYKINSGFRTEKQNNKVKGSYKSSHLKGLAADIRELKELFEKLEKKIDKLDEKIDDHSERLAKVEAKCEARHQGD